MSELDHPIRKGAVLELETNESGISKLVVVSSRLLDIDERGYKYELVDYSNTYKWTFHEEDLNYIFSDTGHTSTDTKIYQSMQPGLYEVLKQEYGELGRFPNGRPESLR